MRSWGGEGRARRKLRNLYQGVDVRIAVISPFVDKQHGTERAVAELIERLANQRRDEIDLYSQRVADVKNLKPSGKYAGQSGSICWHPVAEVRGPHIWQFLRWLFLNTRARIRYERMTGSVPDVIFSAGINALDADVILVHVVFHRLAELQTTRDGGGLRGLHRKLYYWLLCRLEQRIYCDSRVTLAAVSKHTAEQLAQYFGRQDVAVIPNGVDARYFSAKAIRSMRNDARRRNNCAPGETVLLLVGNDWRNKGLRALLAALALCSKELPLRVQILGQDEQTPFRAEADRLGISGRVDFFAPVEDVRSFYAAADALVAPSLEDSFNLPVLEAMACGLPVIVSRNAGVSEWLTHGFDSLLLKDPQNASELGDAIRALATQPELRKTLADNAVATAERFSWDEHTAKLRGLLEAAATKKIRGGA